MARAQETLSEKPRQNSVTNIADTFCGYDVCRIRCFVLPWPLDVKRLIIAIDGPVGSGKSTLARRVAALMGYLYIDTGAMYRSVALKAHQRGISLDASDQLAALAGETRIDLRQQAGAPEGTQQVLLDGKDVTALIRTPEVAQAASKVALVPGVRKVLVAEQRRAGEQGGVVMEGRDIGSVVFPEAQLKIFLTASPEVRAERRWREHQQKGDSIDLARTLEEIRERDRRDLNRTTSPLIRAKDAVVVDSTAMEPEEVARLVVMLAKEQTSANAPTNSS
jgi:cytidylate kinase